VDSLLAAFFRLPFGFEIELHVNVCSLLRTRSQAVARIADRTAKNCRVTWRRPRPISGKFICAPARHSPYKAVYQIWCP